MNKLYQKNEIWFAVVWIIIYVVGTSIVDSISQDLQLNKIPTFVFHVILCVVVIGWMNKQKLFDKYGLCKANASASKFLYYIPLLIIASCNLWFGLTMNLSITESVFFAGSMVCVGFIEEIIFRGFLFKAMAKEGIKTAIIVSSVTFGIGHIVNLFNGSSDNPITTICQIVYAIAIGFLFVIIFYRGGSLWPCILTHSLVNSLSVFADESQMTDQIQIITAIILTIVPIIYSMILLKTLPKQINVDIINEA